MTDESKCGNGKTDLENKDKIKDEKGGCSNQRASHLQGIVRDEEDSQDRPTEEDHVDEKQEDKAENSDEDEQESECSSSESESDSSMNLFYLEKKNLHLIYITNNLIE